MIERLVRRASKFPDLPLDPLEIHGLDSRDAALAHAIDHAVAKRWLTLVALIQSRLDRPWERVQPELQAALLAAAAQLFFLDRIPDHAAVDESVEWVKRHVRPKAGGFVNAILRSLIQLRGDREAPPMPPPKGRGVTDRDLGPDELPLADGRIMKLNAPAFAEDPQFRLAQQTSHSEALIAHWSTAHGERACRILCLHDVVEPPIIIAGMDDAGPPTSLLSPHRLPGFAVFNGSHFDLLELLKSHSRARVQDPTSARPAMATRELRPRLIADLCAGRGTKTAQLAGLHPAAGIIASDADPGRHQTLMERFAGHKRITVIDRSQWLDYAGRVDLLVLDVPCSNTGVLARRVEAKYRFSGTHLEEIVSLQRQILADSLALRSADGRVLYATCSILRQENQEQAAWLTRWHGLERESEELTMPAGLPCDPPAIYHDGGYWVLMK